MAKASAVKLGAPLHDALAAQSQSQGAAHHPHAPSLIWQHTMIETYILLSRVLIPPCVCACRETDRDMVIKGYRVPRGMTLMLSPHPMHVSSLNYLHPDKFWPERWVSDAVSEWDPEHAGRLAASLLLLRLLLSITVYHTLISRFMQQCLLLLLLLVQCNVAAAVGRPSADAGAGGLTKCCCCCGCCCWCWWMLPC